MSTPFSRTGRKEIGKEYPPKSESVDFKEMILELQEEMREDYPAGAMPRQAHPKMHGLLKAEFTVEKNLPDNLRKGLFAEEKTFPAYIRLSNASGKIQADNKADIRGMAIKLLGVPGDKLITKESAAETQDFVLISNETFVAKNVHQFSRTIKAVTANNKLIFILFVLNPLNWGVLYRAIKANIKPGSVLEIPYFSTTPYQFGDVNHAVKYVCIPRDVKQVSIPQNPDQDFLRYEMIAKLSKGEKYYDFFLQFQEDAYSMPIEDPTVKWSSTPIKVATLHIPSQNFDTDENLELGENLSFSPWHSLSAHRPLGGFNRARRWIYEAMAEFRHERNGVNMEEPKSFNNN
jgi:catalase